MKTTPKLNVSISVEIKDKTGKVLKRKTVQAKSYTRQMIDAFQIMMSQIAADIKDTTGANRSTSPIAEMYDLTAEASNDDFGILCGTDDTAPTISDYVLGVPIAEGSGAGQFSHGAVSIGTVVIVGSTSKFTIARTFTNNSGNSIEVEEVALVFSDGTYFFLIDRSLLNFTVADGLSGTVTYTISVTV